MKLIDSVIDVNPDLSLLNIQDNKKFVFFDIETTGFVAVQTSLYLIGCIYKENDIWKFRQWFLESHNEEPAVLREFSEFLATFDTIIHFNGTTFDIPYMNKKYARYKQPSPFDRLESIDIYKCISPYKKYLALDSLKQKSCEQFLGLFREDPFSGGELIQLYKAYTETFDKRLLEVLLLHNSEDLTGMLSILPMLAYARIFDTKPDFVSSTLHEYTTADNVTTAQELFFEFAYPFCIPVAFKYTIENNILLSFEENRLKLRVPVYSGELKYFYPNYKDYFYLPIEDYAIHKSVAQFVDKEYRQKATAANCYAKKTGDFIPVCAKVVKTLETVPIFKESAAATTAYFELPESGNDIDFYKLYLEFLLKNI